MTYVSMSKEALRAYQMREMAMSDWTSGLNHAREEGEEGIKEGIKEGKLEVARNLKSMGIPVEQIALGTGLSIEEIGRI
jgi:predicted transposase/invertase (TIGR01784 family)